MVKNHAAKITLSSRLKAESERDRPWFWICREANFDLTGPSGDDPFTHMLMSVKIGSESPVKSQPLLTPLQMMYFGHSTA